MSNVITRKKYAELSLKTEKLKNELESLVNSLNSDASIGLSAKDKLINAIKDYLSAANESPDYKVDVFKTSIAENNDKGNSDRISGRRDILDILYKVSVEKLSCLIPDSSNEETIHSLLQNGFLVQVKMNSSYISDSYFMLTDKGRNYLDRDEGAMKMLPEYIRDLPQKWNDTALYRAAIINKYFSMNDKQYLIFCDPAAPQFPIGVSIDTADKIEYAAAGVFDTVDTERELMFFSQFCSKCRNMLLLITDSEQNKKELEYEWGLDTGDLPNFQWYLLEVENG